MSQQETIARGSFTIKEFCERHRISRASYFTMPIKPLVLQVAGGRITPEAEALWLKAVADYSNSEAAQLEKARRIEHAKRAGAAAAKSPLHISKRNKAKASKVSPPPKKAHRHVPA